MSVCIFFGHRDCYGLNVEKLRSIIEELITRNGIDTFYVGHQGNFDGMVLSCLKKVKEDYPHISYSVVLAYLPEHNGAYQGYSVYPEGMENVPRRFSVECRNKWMIERAKDGYCVCYVERDWGGAYKFVRKAQRSNITVINLGNPNGAKV